MESYKCKYCGATINPVTMECEYCGAKYKRDHDNVLMIESYINPVEKVVAQAQLGVWEMEHLSLENKSDFIMQRLAEELSKGILPFMQYRTGFDPRTMRYGIQAEVRVVIPKHNVMDIAGSKALEKFIKTNGR